MEGQGADIGRGDSVATAYRTSNCGKGNDHRGEAPLYPVMHWRRRKSIAICTFCGLIQCPVLGTIATSPVGNFR